MKMRFDYSKCQAKPYLTINVALNNFECQREGKGVNIRLFCKYLLAFVSLPVMLQELHVQGQKRFVLYCSSMFCHEQKSAIR